MNFNTMTAEQLTEFEKKAVEDIKATGKPSSRVVAFLLENDGNTEAGRKFAKAEGIHIADFLRGLVEHHVADILANCRPKPGAPVMMQIEILDALRRAILNTYDEMAVNSFMLHVTEEAEQGGEKAAPYFDHSEGKFTEQ